MKPDTHLQQIADQLTHYVIPLYIDVKGVPTHVGSGFFVRVSKHTFLVTAAHVIDQKAHGSIYFYAEPNLARHLDGNVRTTPTFGQDRARDKVDIAVVQLTSIAPPPYPGVGKMAVDLHELRPRALPRAGKRYMVLGFPTTKNEASRVRREIAAEAWSWSSDSLGADAYAKREVTESLHLLVHFDLRTGRAGDGSRVRFPKPKGMSGSPIFQIDDDASPEGFGRFGFPVVAIATEYSSNDRLIQGTDVAVALHLIGLFLADAPP